MGILNGWSGLLTISVTACGPVWTRAGLSTDIRTEYSAEACLRSLLRTERYMCGSSQEQIYKHFVSYGLCYCALSSCCCCGTCRFVTGLPQVREASEGCCSLRALRRFIRIIVITSHSLSSLRDLDQCILCCGVRVLTQTPESITDIMMTYVRWPGSRRPYPWPCRARLAVTEDHS